MVAILLDIQWCRRILFFLSDHKGGFVAFIVVIVPILAYLNGCINLMLRGPF